MHDKEKEMKEREMALSFSSSSHLRSAADRNGRKRNE